MESFGNPKSWAPYMNTDDCSQGFCSFHCPQWCYIPSHPPPPFSFPDDKSGPKFSPVIVSIIGILASAFLLVSYFAIISKFCGSTESSRTENRDPSEELEDNHNPSNHEPWHVATTGLDEALIKLIAVHKFRKGDGVVEGSDCSVCLGEFEEEESLRLLPKCNHAFHVKCIDAWLKAHSNCPLCRANIVVVSSSSPPGTVTETETPLNNVASPERRSEIHSENATAAEDIETGGRGVEISEADVPKTPIRALRNAEDHEERDIIIEVRDEENEHIRRWVSMDYSCRGCVPIGDVFQVNQSEDFEVEEFHIQGGSGSSKHRNRMLQGATRPAAMKRSFSSGRFLFTKHGRGRNLFTPF